MPQRAEPKAHLDYLAGLYPVYVPAIRYLIDHGFLYARSGSLTQYFSDHNLGFYLNKNGIDYIKNTIYRRADYLSKAHPKYLLKEASKILICKPPDWFNNSPHWERWQPYRAYPYLIGLLGKDYALRILLWRDNEVEVHDPYRMPAQAHLTILTELLNSGRVQSHLDAPWLNSKVPKLILEPLTCDLPWKQEDWENIKVLPYLEEFFVELSKKSVWL